MPGTPRSFIREGFLHSTSVHILLMPIIGGVGTVWGPVIAVCEWRGA